MTTDGDVGRSRSIGLSDSIVGIGGRVFNNEVTVGNLVAVGAAIVSAIAVLASLSRERALRKKELADRVRQSAATVIAKLDRWKQIALQTFDQLQMAVTDADGLIAEKGDPVATRDFFWKRVVAAAADLEKSVLDEEIEIAYSGMYGYDPRIHELFTAAVGRIREVEQLVFLQLLNRTQKDILTIRADDDCEIVSAQLGNRLRLTLAKSRLLLEKYMEMILCELRKGMTTLICADDDALLNHRVSFPAASILPDLKSLQTQIYSVPAGGLQSCQRIFDSVSSSDFGEEAYQPWPLGIRFPERTDAGS